MNKQDYHIAALEAKYDEEPVFNSGFEVALEDFIDFDSTDDELKIYLNILILCRSYYGTYSAWPKDYLWFLNSFFKSYTRDKNRVELSEAIRTTSEMILGDGVFAKKIIATQFMISILEFYAKHFLGYRPMKYDFFDKAGKLDYLKHHSYSSKGNRDIGLYKAFELLQKLNLPISASLNKIDTFTSQKLAAAGIKKGRWIEYTISKRLSLYRNAMMHGEFHNFYSIGEYVLMLYCLFYLHD